MKAKLKASGALVIRAENELEAYALRKWSDENYGEKSEVSKCVLVDSSFPDSKKTD